MIHNIHYYLENTSNYEVLFKSYYSRLCGYANQFLKDVDASEEIVQDLFYKLWKDRDKMEEITNLDSYLFRAVRNSCLNQIKHLKIKEDYKKYNQEVLRGQEEQADDMVAGELEEKIRDAIDRLPTERKKVFILSRYEGLKYREIADKLMISIKTVENQMGKAIRFLRDELSEYLVIGLIALFELLNYIK